MTNKEASQGRSSQVESTQVELFPLSLSAKSYHDLRGFVFTYIAFRLQRALLAIYAPSSQKRAKTPVQSVRDRWSGCDTTRDNWRDVPPTVAGCEHAAFERVS